MLYQRANQIGTTSGLRGLQRFLLTIYLDVSAFIRRPKIGGY